MGRSASAPDGAEDVGTPPGGEAGHPPARRGAAAGRGRPFSDATERAILQATTELLAERGLAAMTIEEVAARAHVSKASVYRRWTSKGTLAFDAFVADFLERQPVPDTGTLRADLLGTLRSWIRVLKQGATARTLKGLIAEVQRDTELAEAWRERFVVPVRARHYVLVQRAIDRGELRADANTGFLLDLLYGPAYHRLLHGHLPLNDAFAEDVVAVIMAAVDAGVL